MEFYLGYNFSCEENFCLIRSIGISHPHNDVDFSKTYGKLVHSQMSYRRCRKLKIKRVL
jgi:hypothetical protein